MGIASIIKNIDKLLWGWPMITVLLGTHLFMSFRTGFIQKDIFKAIKLSVTKDPDTPGDVSQFGALATALASTVGTANIIRVGTAIVLGGAMYALDRGLKLRWLGIIFAIFAAICGLGIGCSVPANAVVSTVTQNFAHDEATVRLLTYITTAILCTSVGFVIIGGVKSITRVSEMLVPFMAAFYVIGCMIILIMNADVMGETITTIVGAAFSSRAATVPSLRHWLFPISLFWENLFLWADSFHSRSLPCSDGITTVNAALSICLEKKVFRQTY